MPHDPYESCPCGSGKKFRFCCQPIHVDIDRAYRQDAEGQHDVALRIMDEVVAQHPDNPEAWGRKAQLLYQNDKVEQAEEALAKALEVNPSYPFGHLLRGMFRYYEGELPGALLTFRKAADLYDPQAKDYLGQIYGFIADCELRMERPIAARAALLVALRCRPDLKDLQEQFDRAFGDKSGLPECARGELKLLAPGASVSGARRTAWDRAVSNAAAGRFSEVARGFGELAQQESQDGAAWYNLGVARAWLGDNSGSLDAFNQYLDRELDEERAARAGAVCEVLRFGHGMEAVADCVEYSVTYQIRNAQGLMQVLGQWQQAGRLAVTEAREDAPMFSGLVMDAGGLIATAPRQGQPIKIGANIVVMGPILRLRHVNKETLGRVCRDLTQLAGSSLSPGIEETGHAGIGDALLEVIVFPLGVEDGALILQANADSATQYFEEKWLNRPLKSLNQIPPADAAGTFGLRKKLAGVILFLEQVAARSLVQKYDFNRLRRKLGLLAAHAASAAQVPADLSTLGPNELATLPVKDLSDADLTQAYQTASRLQVLDAAERMAHELVSRPPAGDRSPLYFFLVQRALESGRSEDALNYVDAGQKADCEHNEGRRANDFQLRRAQIHRRRAEPDQAFDVFGRLIERDPSNLSYRTAAVEAMLQMRQGPRALQFAESAVAEARKQNDRDSERHFLELVSAAQKQVG